MNGSGTEGRARALQLQPLTMKNSSSRVPRACLERWLSCLGLALFLALAACGSEPTGDDDIDIRVDAMPVDPPIDAPNVPPIDAPQGPTCGDRICAGNEASTCPSDCWVCGNGVCEGNEASTCASDCTVCGNGVCEAGESNTCSADCPTTARLAVRNQSSYSIFYLYVAPCGSTSWGNNQLGSNIIPSGGTFTLNGIPPGCWYFRAQTSSSVNIYWQTPNGVNLTAGQTYTWTLVN